MGNVDFLLLTDNPHLTVEGWDCIPITAPVPGDPIRSARMLKIKATELIRGYSETLWIDNRVVLTENPETILDELLRKDDIAIPHHSFRATLAEEFKAVLDNRYDDPIKVRELLALYGTEFKHALNEKPYWTAIIARRQTPTTNNLMDTWANLVLRYSRRDQLSLMAACAHHEFWPKGYDLDNFESSYHHWMEESQIRSPQAGRWTRDEGNYRYSLRDRTDDQMKKCRLLARRLKTRLNTTPNSTHRRSTGSD